MLVLLLMLVMLVFTIDRDRRTITTDLPLDGFSFGRSPAVTLLVDKSGVVFWNNAGPYALPQLSSELHRYVNTTKDPNVIIRGTSSAVWTDFVQVLDVVRAENIKKVSIVTQPGVAP